MTAFTRKLSELGLDMMSQELAARLESAAPGVEHGISGRVNSAEAFAPAGLTVLVPAREEPPVRAVLESLLRERLESGDAAVVLDMDLASPYCGLLGVSNDEGLSDHFLYGLSRDKLPRASSSFPGVRVITPGTFTPRAADIHRHRKWKSLLDWLAEPAGTDLIVIAPPLSRFREIAPLSGAAKVVLITDQDGSHAAESIMDLLQVLSGQIPGNAVIRVLWTPQAEDNTQQPPGETPDEETEEPEIPAEVPVEPDAPQVPEEPEIPVEVPVEPETPDEPVEVPDEPGEPEEPGMPVGVSDEPEPEAPDEPVEVPDEPGEPEEPGMPVGMSDEPEPEAPDEPVEVPDEPGEPEEPEIPVEVPVEPEAPDEPVEVPDEPGEPEEPEIPVEVPVEPEAPDEPVEVPDEPGVPEEPEIPVEVPDEPEESGISVGEPGETLSEKETDSVLSGDIEERTPEEEDSFEMPEWAAEEVEPEIGEPAGPPEAQAADRKNAAAEEDEIFLPDELLFLDDEGEEKPSSAVSGRSFEDEFESLGRGELSRPGAPEREIETSGLDLPATEWPSVPNNDTEEELFWSGTKELETLTEIPGEGIDTELSTVEPDQESESVAEAPLEESTVTAGDLPAEHDDAEALFMDAEAEEEEDAEAEEKGLPQMDEELAEQALQQIEGFEDALKAGEQDEVELNLDLDPLSGDKPVAEPAESVEEIEELEEIGESELSELESEPLEEETDPAPGMETAIGEETGLEPAEEPRQAVEQQVTPLDDADLEDLEDLELEVQAEPAGKSEGLVELDDEQEPAGAAAGDEGGWRSSDVEDLLGEDTDLVDLDTDIDLGDDSLGKATKVKIKPVRKRKTKKSGTHPLAWLVLLMILTGGLFYLWKEGTVSSLVRGNSMLSGLLQKAGLPVPGMEEDNREAEAQAARQAEESAAKAAPVLPQLEAHEFSVQVGSYRFLPQALAARDYLEKSGLGNVFVAPVQLDSLGHWNRLFVGVFASSSRADTAIMRLMPELKKAAATVDLPGQAIRRRTPWAIKVGDFSAGDSLQAVLLRLSENGIPSYTVPLSADMSPEMLKLRVYVGAFEEQSQAIYIRTLLFNIGVTGTIEERQGPVEPKEAPPAAPGQV